MLDSRFLSLLACPVDGSALGVSGDGSLVSPAGRVYPVVEGVPVLFHPAASDSIGAMARSRVAAADAGTDRWWLDTLDVADWHRPGLREAVERWGTTGGQRGVDPVVEQMVAATCGNLYLGLVGRLPRYPIPVFRLAGGHGRLMLDVGCNWGRWCFAAAREGFTVLGIDPQLGAVLAAKRVAEQLGVTDALFVCGDARHLPIQAGAVDVVFSYSVLQHLERAEVAAVIAEVVRCLQPGGELLVQMPNSGGLWNRVQQARRGWREARDFEVRYWSVTELRALVVEAFEDVELTMDCFFGIGMQAADADLMNLKTRVLIWLSEWLRGCPILMPWADSVYVAGRRRDVRW